VTAGVARRANVLWCERVIRRAGPAGFWWRGAKLAVSRRIVRACEFLRPWGTGSKGNGIRRSAANIFASVSSLALTPLRYIASSTRSPLSNLFRWRIKCAISCAIVKRFRASEWPALTRCCIRSNRRWEDPWRSSLRLTQIGSLSPTRLCLVRPRWPRRQPVPEIGTSRWSALVSEFRPGVQEPALPWSSSSPGIWRLVSPAFRGILGEFPRLPLVEGEMARMKTANTIRWKYL